MSKLLVLINHLYHSNNIAYITQSPENNLILKDINILKLIFSFKKVNAENKDDLFKKQYEKFNLITTQVFLLTGL